VAGMRWQECGGRHAVAATRWPPRGGRHAVAGSLYGEILVVSK
jgi:hypothetical protein